MGVARAAGTLFEAVAVVFLAVLVVGQVLGQPLVLGFVTTGSMEPALQPGDGFVAVPPALAGDIEEGDVVTYRAEEIQGGGLTTHRVVEVTDRGYVTKGDANPFTDQDSGEPLVKDAQVVAVVWQPGGSVLAIPGVGALVTGVQGVLTGAQRWLASLLGTRALLGTQGLALLVTAVSLLAYVADVLRSGDRRRSRSTDRDAGTSVYLVMAVFTAAIVLAATVTMLGPAGPREFGVVSAESDAPGPRIIETGTSEQVPYLYGNGGFVPVVVYSEPATPGVDVQPREVVVPARSEANATLTLSAPPETGYYRRYVVEHRYLLVLPLPVIRWLYGIHPWLPVLAVDAALGVPFYVLGVALVGRGRVRQRGRDGPSRLQRLASRFD